MRSHLAYDEGPEAEPFEIPDAHPVEVLAPRDGALLPAAALFERALEHPVDGPRLEELAEGARSVLLLVDDATRGTPTIEILPRLAREIQAAGVPDSAVTVLTAQGTHRRMHPDELLCKVGGNLLARWRVVQHDHLDEAELCDFGETPGGMPVVANRLVAEADVVVGVGHVGVHGIMGYSGGAKILFPGVCGYASEAWTHWRAASRFPTAETMGVLENPVRREIEEASRMAGLDAVFNVVLDPRGFVQHAAYGDFVRVHRESAGRARDLYAVPLDEPADVVVTDAHPADRDYWQSVKGLYAASLCVREGGVVVLVAPNPEGVAENHPNVLDLAGLAPEEIRRRVEDGEAGDIIGAAVALYTALSRERADVILVSSGIRPEDARRLGFTPEPTPQRGVDEALRRAGPGASVAVVKHGGGILPLVRGVNRERVLREAERAEPAR